MGIAGMTDQPPQLPLAGVLRKGSKKQMKDGREIQGNDLPYFRFEGKGSEAAKRRSERIFRDIYGEEPNQITIWLVHPHAEDNFDAWMTVYGNLKNGKRKRGGWLKQKCDRTNIVQWMTATGYRFDPKPCQYNWEEDKCPLGCKPEGKLYFWIPELFRSGIADPILLLTHAKNDIPHLSSALKYWASVIPDIRGVPFVLEKEGELINRPGFDNKGDRIETRGEGESWLVRLRPDPAWVQRRFSAQYEQQMGLLPDRPIELLKSANPSPQVLPPEPIAATTVEATVTTVIDSPSNAEAIALLDEVCELTGCTSSVLQTYARQLKTNLQTISIENARRIRSMVFMEWASMQHQLSQEQAKTLFKDFWQEGDRTQFSTKDLWDAWRLFINTWAVERRVERDFR